MEDKHFVLNQIAFILNEGFPWIMSFAFFTWSLSVHFLFGKNINSFNWQAPSLCERQEPCCDAGSTAQDG